MYRVPPDLDLSPVIGKHTTQIGVGQFDLQITFGPVHFAVQSPIRIFRGKELIAQWQEGKWPDPGFYDIMNVEVLQCEIPNDRQIVLHFENGLEMLLEDSLDQYESMQIFIAGRPGQWII
ncbi:MAG: hypothetical protein DWQ01_00610 [Planctomycetota bacterium]|nr:MAG: hypothetical protein DWQ01_00610 [Planctomycetota bacterium]